MSDFLRPSSSVILGMPTGFGVQMDVSKFDEGIVRGYVMTLSMARFTVSSERELQQGVAKILGVNFEREYALTPRDRPDFFWVRGGIVCELKFGASGGSLRHITEQLARYAEHILVRHIIVASPSARILRALPSTLQGKGITPVRLHTAF